MVEDPWPIFYPQGLKETFEPQMAPVFLSPLPICENCPNEVKPGEDECWDCLGEKMPVEYAWNIVIDGISPYSYKSDELFFTWPAQGGDIGYRDNTCISHLSRMEL